MSYIGEGTLQNYEESAKWFRLVAVKDPNGYLTMGDAYYKGRGAPKNYKMAAERFRLTVENGIYKDSFKFILIFEEEQKLLPTPKKRRSGIN
jgi:TPR repeat protein